MIGMLVALMLLSWIFGRTRGLIGGLAGGFVGALVVAGMTAATSNGELAALYSPGRLAWVAVPAAVVAAVLALVAPYAIGFAAAGWAIGALLAAMTASGADQSVYSRWLPTASLLAPSCSSRDGARQPWSTEPRHGTFSRAGATLAGGTLVPPSQESRSASESRRAVSHGPRWLRSSEHQGWPLVVASGALSRCSRRR